MTNDEVHEAIERAVAAFEAETLLAGDDESLHDAALARFEAATGELVTSHE